MWQLMDRKRVPDEDGFYTDYSWYFNGHQHVFVFGDSDIYRPEDDAFDWECSTWNEASEWFENYTGFEEE